jgi:hypothetical protein
MRARVPPTMLAERHGRCGSQATWLPALPFASCRVGGLRPVRGKPASDLLWRLAAGTALWGFNSVFMGVSTRRPSHLGRFAMLRLRCGNCRAAAGGCHRASLMIKAVRRLPRFGPAGPFRLTALVVSAVHMHGAVRRGRRHRRLFRLRIAGPVGPFRVSLEW